jgi:hypothetical protein
MIASLLVFVTAALPSPEFVNEGDSFFHKLSANRPQTGEG